MRPLLPFAICVAAAAASEAPLTAVGRIPLPGIHGRLDHFAQDTAGQRLFIAALGGDAVAVVDLAQGRLVRSIPEVREPQGLAFLPSLGRLLIAEGGGDAVDLVDASSFAHLARIADLVDADNAHAERADGLVYVGCGSGSSSAIVDIDPRTGSLARRCPLPGHPEGFALEGSGPRLFVNVPSERAVIVLDRASGGTLARWALVDAAANFPLGLDERSRRLFVACRSPAVLLAYDTADGRLIASLACCGDADEVLVDEARKRLYVVGGEGAITVADISDPAHPTALARVETADGARTAWFDPAASRLYVACPERAERQAEIRIYSPAP